MLTYRNAQTLGCSQKTNMCNVLHFYYHPYTISTKVLLTKQNLSFEKLNWGFNIRVQKKMTKMCSINIYFLHTYADFHKVITSAKFDLARSSINTVWYSEYDL